MMKSLNLVGVPTCIPDRVVTGVGTGCCMSATTFSSDDVVDISFVSSIATVGLYAGVSVTLFSTSMLSLTWTVSHSG